MFSTHSLPCFTLVENLYVEVCFSWKFVASFSYVYVIFIILRKFYISLTDLYITYISELYFVLFT